MAALQTRTQSEQQGVLGETLALVAARVRNQRRTRGSMRGLVVALALDIVLAGLSRAALLPDGFPASSLLFALPIAGASVGGYFASRSPITRMHAARLAEASLPLKERLSSALEFSQTAQANPLLGLQHADAEAHARALNTRQIAPRQVPREAWLVLFLLPALALLLCLPNLPFGPSPAQRAERDAVRSAGRQLAQAAHAAAAQADARHQPDAKRQAQKMEALGKRMAQGHMDRAQALAAVSRQEQQLAQSGQTAPNAPSDPGQASKDIAKASQSPAPASTQPPASPQSASTSASSSDAARAPAAHLGPHTPSGAAKQAGRNTAPQPASGQASRTAGAAGRRLPSAPPAQSAPEAQQALEDARRRLAAPGQPGSPAPAKPATSSPAPSPSVPAKPGSAAQSGTPGKANNASANSAGKANNASANGAKKPGGQMSGSSNKPGGQSQSSASKPKGQNQGSGSKASGIGSKAGGGGSAGGSRTNSAASQPGKGQNGQPGQGKSEGRSVSGPGGTPGQPAPGGGAGQAAKAPFRSALPPTTASKNQALYLGTPRQGSAPGQTLPKRSGLPAARGGASRVPYGTALPRYRKSAEAALDQEQVPPSQRAVVRDYFNSLQPAK